MRLIPLVGLIGAGSSAIVDDEDFERLSGLHWVARRDKPDGRDRLYARARAQIHGDYVYLHRMVLGAGPGEMVDHKNGNTLDNRRSNLRLATSLQQRWNAAPLKCVNGQPKTSRFKGVRLTESGRWRARITVHGTRLELGRFGTQREAAKAYDAAAVKYFGEFARLNAA